MLNISKFFQKFQKIHQDESEKKEKIIAAIKEVTRIELKKDQVLLKDGTLYITASPLIRNEIMMRRLLILNSLKTSGIDVANIK